MRRFIKDDPHDRSANDLLDQGSLLVDFYERRTNRKHLRANKKRWRTSKAVGDDPVKKKKS